MKNPQRRFDVGSNELRFGGSLLTKAKNRHARPLSSRDPIHLILKSSKAVGAFSLAGKNAALVNSIVKKHGAKFGVKLIKYSNNFNHLHLLVRFPSRAIYLRFIRSLSASIAMAVTGAKKSKSLQGILKRGKFWDSRPFTRVVRSFRGFRIALDYVFLNSLEAACVIPKREGRLKSLTADERRYFSFGETTNAKTVRI